MVPAIAPEAQDHKHPGPQQQEEAQGSEEDSEEGAELHAQVLTALSPGRVDGEGHTAVDRDRDSSAVGRPQEVSHNSPGSPVGKVAGLQGGYQVAGLGSCTWPAGWGRLLASRCR